MGRRRATLACVVAGTTLLMVLIGCPRAAFAYPTSIVFAPTGEVKDFGTFAHVGFGAMILSPKAAPGVSWFANEVGLLPKIPYGSSGTGFGGLEAGIDAYSSDNFGLPNAFVKPLVNAKVQVLTEYSWVPAIGGGFIAAPFQGTRSQNMFFGAVTKSLNFGTLKFGRITLGFGHCVTKDKTVFYGTPPFFEDKSSLLFGGYETPALGPFSIGIDHVGGVGEINSTNVALNVTPFEGASLGIGSFFGNDRRLATTRIDGAFAFVALTWNAIKVFSPKPPATPDTKAKSTPTAPPGPPGPTTSPPPPSTEESIPNPNPDS